MKDATLLDLAELGAAVYPTRLRFPVKIPCQDVEVTPAKYSHVPKLAESWFHASTDDPMRHYLVDTPDYRRGPYVWQARKAAAKIFVAFQIHHNIALTVDAGAAMVFGSYAKNSPDVPRGPVNHLVDSAFRHYRLFLASRRTKEQRKRNEEVMSKLNAVIQRCIGDRASDMFLVGLLATAPASQGKGYGSALLDTVTRMADKEGMATWLTSSNISNTEVYNSHGFITISEVIIGDTNPTWDEPPVILSVMIREPAPPMYVDEKCDIGR